MLNFNALIQVLCVVVWVVVWGTPTANAEQSVGAQSQNNTYFKSLALAPGFNNIAPNDSIYILQDVSGDLDISELMRLPPAAFQLQGPQTPNFGLDAQSSYWLKLRLRSAEKESWQVFAELDFPSLRHVDVFITQGDTVVEHYPTGLDRGFSSRPIAGNNYVIPVALHADKTTDIYFRIESDGPLVAPLRIWEKPGLTDHVLHSHMLITFYLGLVIALSIYNLVLYFNIKDSAYLFYTLHLLCICWFQASMMGYTSMYLWNNSQSSLPYYEPVIVACLALAIVLQFTRKFLMIEKISAPLDRALNVFAYLSLGIIAIALTFPLYVAVNIIFAAYGVTIAVLAYTGIYAIRSEIRSARYFLVGWGLLIGGSLVQQQLYKNNLPFNFFTKQAILFASAIEAIMMSFALADRINLMRKEKVQAHRQALESAEQSNTIKDQFLATISHELRTPMNGVLGALELVDQQALKPEDRQAIQVARLSSRRMLTLINGLLNYTEAQIENAHICKHTFRIPKDVNDLLDHLQQACASRHLQLKVNTNFDEDTYFYGDIEKIRTLLLHLTENSLKFTNEGTIAINFSNTPHSDNPQQSQLHITIEDTGVGICPERQGEIFQAFNQLDSDFNRKQGGLGIGLALVKQLVRILGGNIDLESAPGEGTRFKIALPVDRFSEESPLAEPKNLAYIHQNQEPFVLIAEDNEINQKILAALCSKLGYRSIVALNGEAAVTIAKQVTPALIFMDCQMPIMDGFEATRKIRLLNPQMHQVPIIAVTANASGKDQQRCFQAGMNDHITKPISLNSIQRCLLRWLPEQQHQEKLLQRANNDS